MSETQPREPSEFVWFLFLLVAIILNNWVEEMVELNIPRIQALDLRSEEMKLLAVWEKEIWDYRHTPRLGGAGSYQSLYG